MKKLIPLLLLSTSVNAGWFNFNHEEWVGYETDIPDTSYDYYYGEGLTSAEPNNLYYEDIVNSTTMKLYKGDMWVQTIYGVEFPFNRIPGVYESFEHWDFRGSGNYTIVVEIHLEHNNLTPFGCNLGSDCYVPSDESYVEILTDTLNVVILEDINIEPETPVEPETVPETPIETPVEAPVVDSKPSLPETEVIAKAEADEPELDEVIVISADDYGEAGGGILWLLLIPMIRRLTIEVRGAALLPCPIECLVMCRAKLGEEL